ncbi:hypothetical protein [Daejeonella lutea]|uniref:Uncharacterized protein n=1 Tax=Daejeonella lutea TaxID=572036 RepID=A0A1T5B0V3_9SPHI|nr:hypothetical protein [Daejeonella lutea]SKB40493.1 hypothetical protein SAMN05661099_1164 [Daejeonella lutea]
MTTDQAELNLNNFLSSYNIQESTELLNQVFDQVNNSINADQVDGKAEGMLDFLEALEELIPCIYTPTGGQKSERD